jgi:hypothetical protein
MKTTQEAYMIYTAFYDRNKRKGAEAVYDDYGFRRPFLTPMG